MKKPSMPTFEKHQDVYFFKCIHGRLSIQHGTVYRQIGDSVLVTYISTRTVPKFLKMTARIHASALFTSRMEAEAAMAQEA